MENYQKIILFTLTPILMLGAIFYIKPKEPKEKDNNQKLKVNQPTKGALQQMENTQVSQPDMIIDQNKNYQVVLKTSKGDITIDLNEKQTPKTVNNFVYLANKDFYNQTIFHRVIKGFMIQGGDPEGDGTGGPGYQFDDEPFEGDYSRGTVAMANSGPNTNGSQFFIMHQDKNLPKNYVIFGEVVDGMDVVDQIANSEVKQSPRGENSVPVNPSSVTTVEIIEK